MIPTFTCVLKTGGDYKPEHVQALARQVAIHTTLKYRFLCYSDTTIEGVETVPLEGNFEGWWAVPEVFRNQGPTIIVGIDTVIRQNIDQLFLLAQNCSPEDFWMIKAFADPNKTASGIMVYNGDWSWLWEEYKTANASGKYRGEQDYTNAKLKERGIKPRIIQDTFKGVYSWKKHCVKQGIPEDCKVILFHGKPRPFDVPELWKTIVSKPSNRIPKLWNDETVYIVGGGPSLLDEDLSLIHNKKVLGVNQAFELGDWVDVCYSGDKRWYGWNHKRLRRYPGTMITSYPNFTPKPLVPTINVGRVSAYGIIDKTPKLIAWNGNSGATAINVAYWLGARRIFLVGFDMRRIGNKYNWHDRYPKKGRNPKTQRYPNPYMRFMKCWRQVAIDAKRLGIEIINTTPDSRLKLFNHIPLKETV